MPPEMLEAIADRAAELLAERLEAEREPWMGVEKAAAYIDCPRSRIYALVSAGRIPCERDGSRLLFRREALDEWLRKGGAKRP